MPSFYARYKQLIPVIFMILVCVFYVCANFVLLCCGVSDMVIPFQTYGAIMALALCLWSFFYLRRAYKYILITTAFLFLINAFNFNNLEASVGINDHHLSMHPLGVMLLLLIYLINHKKVHDYLISKVGPSPAQVAAYGQARFEADVERFAERYKGYSDEHLELIISEHKFTPAAVETARRMLTKRQERQSGHPD